MPTWTSAKWTMRMGSVTWRAPARTSEVKVGGLCRSVDFRASQAHQAQAKEELTAVMDLLLQHVPQDPAQLRGAVIRHLYDSIEVRLGHAGQVVQRGLVHRGQARFHSLQRSGRRETRRRASRMSPADDEVDPLVLKIGDVVQNIPH